MNGLAIPYVDTPLHRSFTRQGNAPPVTHCLVITVYVESHRSRILADQQGKVDKNGTKTPPLHVAETAPLLRGAGNLSTGCQDIIAPAAKGAFDLSQVEIDTEPAKAKIKRFLHGERRLYRWVLRSVLGAPRCPPL